MPTSTIERRTFLRGAGVAMGLPLLDAMVPRTANSTLADEFSTDVRRMLAICAPLGIHTPYLFPNTAGKDYEVTPYLEPLQDVREKFTVISGLKHPDVDGGHSAEESFLTGAAHPGQPSFRNSISVDQFAAERVGHHTRVPSLVLSANSKGLSYTRSGVRIPAESKPSRLFAGLFLDGSASEKQEQLRRIQDGRSIMDLVNEQTRQVAKKLGRDDLRTLDQYQSSVRELEKRLGNAEAWANRPKPKVDHQQPTDIDDRANFTGRMELMYDMIFLAIQTDSTRLITLMGAGGAEVVALKGVEDGWHNLSHHGKDQKKIDQLAIIEREEMRLFGNLLRRLEGVTEQGRTLLDQTMIIMGSNLGNASSHNNTNLPIVTAGGRLKHGQHLAFNPEKPPALCNLFVNCLQHLGLDLGEFSTGTGTLTGI